MTTTTPTVVTWVEEQFGARVATILENRTSVVEIQDLRDGRYSLTVHWTSPETGKRTDLSAEMTAADLAKIGALFPASALSISISTAIRERDEAREQRDKFLAELRRAEYRAAEANMRAGAKALALSVEQEPVAWTNAANLRIMKENEPLYYAVIHHENTAEWNIPLYTAPPSLSTAILERDEARAEVERLQTLGKEMVRYNTEHFERSRAEYERAEAAEALASQARADAIEGAVRTAVLIRGNIRGATDYAKGEADMAAKIIDAIRATLEKDR